MRVGVEEAVPEDHRHPGIRHPVGDVAPLLRAERVEVEVGNLGAVEVLEREHA